jgi:hypothetical protein
MDKEEDAERILEKWINARKDARRFAGRLAVAQKRARALEASHPWLGGIKGTLRKKESQRLGSSKGLQPASVPALTLPGPASSSDTPSTAQSRSDPAPKRKRCPAPLMEKSRRETTVSAKRRKAADKSGALPAAVPSRAVRSVAETPLEELEVAARRREERREAEAQTPEGSEAGTGGIGIEGKFEL